MVVAKQAMGQDVMKSNLPCGLLGSTGLAGWKRRLGCCTLHYTSVLLLAVVSFRSPQVCGGWWELSGCLTQLRTSVNFLRVFFRLGMVPCDTRRCWVSSALPSLVFSWSCTQSNSWPFLKQLATNRHQRFAKKIPARLVSST